MYAHYTCTQVPHPIQTYLPFTGGTGMLVLLSEELNEAGLFDTLAKDTGPLCICLPLRVALPVLSVITLGTPCFCFTAETVALVSAI